MPKVLNWHQNIDVLHSEAKLRNPSVNGLREKKTWILVYIVFKYTIDLKKHFIQILSRFFPDFIKKKLYPNFIQMLS